jgi:multimeric flavodoxin WrbA
MKVLVLSGSRNRQGKTAQAINAICKGVTEAGGKTETIFLNELKLERCRQCNNEGWGICQNEEQCVIKDDFAGVMEKVNSTDVVVFANPVYFGDLSESLRCFLERLRRIRFSATMRAMRGAPGINPVNQKQGTPAVGYCYAGGSGMGTVTALASMEKVLQTCGFDIVDMIPARRQNLEFKLPLLEQVGRWLATKPTSGPPWIPPERR